MLGLGISLGSVAVRAQTAGVLRAAIILGQSNNAARAPWDNGDDYPEDGSILQWTQAGALIDAVRPLDTPDDSLGTNFGPSLPIGLLLRDRYPGDTIVLINHADGGTGFRAGQWDIGGTLHEGAVTRVRAFLAAHPGAVLEFAFHMLGGNDADRDVTEQEYLAYHVAAIDDMRTRFAAPNMPYLVADMYDDRTGGTHLQIRAGTASVPDHVVRSAQVSLVGLTTYDDKHGDAPSTRATGTRVITALDASVLNVPRVPGAPSLTTAPSATSIDVTLEEGFDGHSDATQYVFEVSANGTSGWSVLASGGLDATETDAGLAEGVTRSYRAQVVNAFGSSPYSAVASEETSAVALTVSGFDTDYIDNGATSYTFPDLAVSSSTILVTLYTLAGTTPAGLTATGVTVGGVTATRLGGTSGGTPSGCWLDLWQATGVSGTTADVAVTMNSLISRLGAMVHSVSAPAQVLSEYGDDWGMSAQTISYDATGGGLVLGAHVNRGSGATVSYAFDGGTVPAGAPDYAINPGANSGVSAALREYAAEADGENVVVTSSPAGSGIGCVALWVLGAQ